MINVCTHDAFIFDSLLGVGEESGGIRSWCVCVCFFFLMFNPLGAQVVFISLVAVMMNC